MKRISLLLIVGLLTTLGLSGAASAGVIRSAVGGTIQDGGPGFGTLTETFDQSGLDTPYTSGVTDFDAYLAVETGHTALFGGFEWFSNDGSRTATVTYDLGGIFTIDALALWNEESAGIGTLALWGSADDVSYSLLASGLNPTNWPAIDAPYFADRFDFAATALRYVRLVATDCPQPDAGFTSCSIGEVAFREADAGGVPAPAALLLMGLGLACIGVQQRRGNKAC